MAMILLAAFGASRPAYALPDLLKKWFPQYFGAEDTGPQPEDTLQAPFADPGAQTAPAGEALGGLYGSDKVTGTESGGTLEKPHRNQEQIGEWLVKAVSEMFNFDVNNYDQHLRLLATGMDRQALLDFQTFLQNSNVLKTLQSGEVMIHNFVSETPLLLNKGVIAGRYRWLFEMPVTLTFLPKGEKADYETTKPVNQNVIVTMQVMRVPVGQGVDELMIESFAVRQDPAKPN